MAFFNKGRRGLISKTLMNIVQILIAAGFAGELFMKLTKYAKGLVVLSAIILFLLGIIICPEKEGE